MAKILAIDDEPSVLESYEMALGDEHEITTADSGAEGLAVLDQDFYDLVLLDIQMEGMSGLEALRRMRERGVDSGVIMVTVHRDIEFVVEAMKSGANDYVAKPFKVAELRHTVERNLKMVELERRNRSLEAVVQSGEEQEDIVYTSDAMTEVFEALRKAAPTDASILIMGESGTGKELAAQFVHRHSRRSEGPLITVNCAAIPENLMESELFGHEKGSFSGADQRKSGKFELANRGTLFLDEIATLPSDLQAKLLRAIETRVIERVGGTGPIHLDVRWLAATNHDLDAQVEEGTFREDLYYRLNVINVTMPPLRKRPEDIPLLVSHFLRSFARELKKEPAQLSDDVQEVFQVYAWPGNVRELKNLIERITVMHTGGEVSVEDLPENMLKAYQEHIGVDITEVGESRYKEAIEEFRRAFIVRALRITKGNQARAARLLGLHRNTLIHHIRSMDIRPEEYGQGEG